MYPIKLVTLKIKFRSILKFISICLLCASLHAQTGKIATYKLHTVSAGETFASIAKIYHVDPQQLAEYNNLDYYEGTLMSKSLRIPLKHLPATKAVTKKDAAAIVKSKTVDTIQNAESKPETHNLNSTTSKTDAGKQAKTEINNSSKATPEFQPVYETKKKSFYPAIKNIAMPLLIVIGGIALLSAGIYLYKLSSRR